MEKWYHKKFRSVSFVVKKTCTKGTSGGSTFCIGLRITPALLLKFENREQRIGVHEMGILRNAKRISFYKVLVYYPMRPFGLYC